MAFQVRPLASNFKTLPATIFFSFLLFEVVAAYDRDTNTTGHLTMCLSNYTETINNRTGLVDDEYKDNVETLLTDLTSTRATTALSFYNTTAGESPYTSYGIYLCRGDASSQLCYSCLTNLTNWVRSLDYGNCTERIAYSDFCMFRYANYSFFGRVDNSSVGATLDKLASTQEYKKALVGVVEQVVTLAAYNSSNLFATYEGVVSENETVYALAQCTPDIGRGGCDECLRAAQSYVLSNLTRPKFVFEMRMSCQLRYDNASFFVYPSTTPSSAPAPVSAHAFLVATLGLFFICWLIR